MEREKAVKSDSAPAEAKANELVAYVHNVSPVKSGKYFECLYTARKR